MLAVLVILVSPCAVLAVDPFAQAGLVCLIQSPAGATALVSAPGAAGGSFLPNGTPVSLLGDASGGFIPVNAQSGRGYVDYRHVGAVGDTYMPSASGGGELLPVQPAPGSATITLTLDPASGTIRISTLPQAGTGGGSASGVSAAPGGQIGLLGVTSGTGSGPGTGAGTGAGTGTGTGTGGTGTGGQPAPAPVAAGGWQTRIIATAQGGGTGAGGARLVSSNTFCALPSRAGLNKTAQIQLCDAQGNGYGQPLSAPVLDVGPWRVADKYWETGRRPAAEGLKGQKVTWQKNVGYVAGNGRYRCNGAGIDISFGAWTKLQPGLSLRQAANKTGLVNWTFGSTSRAD